MAQILGQVKFHNQVTESEIIPVLSSMEPNYVYKTRCAVLYERSPFLGEEPSQREDVPIVVDGEIYDFGTFEQPYSRRRFFNLYKEHGEAILAMINGEFCASIWDAEKRKLILVRDRVGTHVLYYHINNDRLIFSSQIKNIIQSSNVNASFNHNVLAEYFMFRNISGADTLFKNIKKLEPGTFLEVNLDRTLRVKTYWDFQFIRQRKSEEYWTDRFDKTFSSAILSRLNNKRDHAGVMLSGGLDSTLITYYLRQCSVRNIYTFTLASKNSRYDESNFAIEAARTLDTEHENFVMEDLDVGDDFARLIWELEEPPRQYNSLLLAKVFDSVKEKTNVLFFGDGPDGFGIKDALFLRNISRLTYLPKWSKQLFSELTHRMPIGKLSAIRDIMEIDHMDLIIFHMKTASLFSEEAKAEIERLTGIDFARTDFKKIYDIYNACSSKDICDRYVYTLFKIFEPGLFKRASVLGSCKDIRIRQPFTDNDIINLSCALDNRIKLKNSSHKYLFKKILKRRFSDEFINRKKKGFNTPLGLWLRDSTKLGNYTELLLENRSMTRGVFDARKIKSIVSDHLSGKIDNSEIIWPVLSLEVWFRVFIDKEFTF